MGAEAEAVRIWLLGGFKVSIGSRLIEKSAWRLRKASALVKLLALAPGHRLHREQVMDFLWPDLGKKAASNNLRQTLHAARGFSTGGQAPATWQAKTRRSCCFREARSGLTSRSSRRRLSPPAARDPAAYRAAIDLYAGDLLPEDRYEEWAEGRRENLRQLYLALLIELAGLYEERDDTPSHRGAAQCNCH